MEAMLDDSNYFCRTGGVLLSIGYASDIQDDIKILGYCPTGSKLQSFFTNLSGSDIQEVTFDIEKKTVPIAQVQDYICKAFGLTVVDLADACQKTRKALYNWREGSIPRPQSAKRLFGLYRVAKDWMESSDPLPKSRLREPLLGGQSLYDLLTSDELDIEAIAFLRRRLDLEASEEVNLDDPFA